MKTVAQLLERKGGEVWSIGPDASVYEALELLAEHDIGALVVSEDDRLVGIVSERDYARKVILLGKRSVEARVEEIMTPKVVYVTKGHTIDQCMGLMTEERIRHLPVLEDGRIVGIISIGDVVRATISEKEHLIEELERYIAGG